MKPPALEPLPSGAVLWEGPSRLDGSPIVAIATFRSDNPKTGRMVQTWILRADIDPISASRTGADRSVCGECPLRGRADGQHARGRACYVNLVQGPRSVYTTYRASRYPQATDAILSRNVLGRPIRLGAYGDPCAVPVGAWTHLLSFGSAGGHTGYTHQWSRPDCQDYRSILMASVESPAQRKQAKALGWATFRVRGEADPIGRGEIVCPASAEREYALTCEECLACKGAGGQGRQRDVVIIAHGGLRNAESMRRIVAAS